MKFEEIVKDIIEGKKTSYEVFGNTKYARKAWKEGDYLGIGPSGYHQSGVNPRPTLAILRDEPFGTISRNWETADKDREADDWYEVENSNET